MKVLSGTKFRVNVEIGTGRVNGTQVKVQVQRE